MRTEMVFKSEVSLALIAEISFLWVMMFAASEEYDATHIETIGFVMAILSAALASAVLLFALYQILKWKPPQA
jgi:hypothetical protein